MKDFDGEDLFKISIVFSIVFVISVIWICGTVGFTTTWKSAYKSYDKCIASAHTTGDRVICNRLLRNN